MRIAFGIIGFVFMSLGVLFIIASTSDRISIDVPKYATCVLGFGLIGLSAIIILLILILEELKQLHK